MKLPLEDDFNDVIGKAQKGLEITTEDLAEKTGVSEEGIRKIRRGEFDAAAVAAVGQQLNLNVDALLKILSNLARSKVSSLSPRRFMTGT